MASPSSAIIESNEMSVKWICTQCARCPPPPHTYCPRHTNLPNRNFVFFSCVPMFVQHIEDGGIHAIAIVFLASHYCSRVSEFDSIKRFCRGCGSGCDDSNDISATHIQFCCTHCYDVYSHCLVMATEQRQQQQQPAIVYIHYIICVSDIRCVCCAPTRRQLKRARCFWWRSLFSVCFGKLLLHIHEMLYAQNVHVPRFKCHTVQLLASTVYASRPNEIHTITIPSKVYLYISIQTQVFDCVFGLALIAFRTSNEAFDVGKKRIRFLYEIELCWGQFYSFHFDGELI